MTDTHRYVDELESVDDSDKHAAPSLVSFAEVPASSGASGDRVLIGMISITPSTGDVVWDNFDGELNFTEPLSSSLGMAQIPLCVLSLRSV